MKLALVNLARSDGDPPLGLAYIAAYLREQSGISNSVIIDENDPLSAIRREKPDLVGISALSFQFPEANRLAAAIKSQSAVPVIVGGYHITAMPHHLKDSHFDIGVRGEGEETMAELMRSFQARRAFPLEDLRTIKGLVFRNERNDNELTEKRPPIDAMDRIPLPARDLLQMKGRYLVRRKAAFSRVGVYAGMLTSRGCPYECAFCSPRGFWETFRPMSASRVVDEIAVLVDTYRVDGIMLWDDLFAVNKKRLREVVELIEERQFQKRTQFAVFARANLIDEESLKLFRRMHVTSVIFGLESGSESVLRYLKKGSVTVGDNYRALRLCKEYGMRTRGTVIIGSPEETKEDIERTGVLIRSPDIDEPIACCLTPLPGTEVWEYARNLGVVRDDVDWDYEQLSHWGFHPGLVVNKRLPAGELESLFKELDEWVGKKARRAAMRTVGIRDLLDFRLIKKVLRNWRKVVRHLAGR